MTMQPPRALLDAVTSKDLEAGERALAEGASASGWSSLVVAIAHGAPASMIDLLLRNGADPNETGGQGVTALLKAARLGAHEASALGTVASVERLLDAGASPFAVDADGRTPLWWVARSGAPEILDAIVRRAVAESPDVRLDALLDEAVASYDGPAKVETLLARGAAPGGVHALVRASGRSDGAIALLLLERGADPNQSDAAGCTPLHAAVAAGCEAVVEALVRRGVSLDAKTTRAVPDSEVKRGDTPRAIAERQARYHQARACEALLRSVPGRASNVGALPQRHPATIDGAFAAALAFCERTGVSKAGLVRPTELADASDRAAREVLTLLERTVRIAERVSASLAPVAPTVHGTWKLLHVEDSQGAVRKRATLALSADGTFEARLDGERLNGTFTLDDVSLRMTAKKMLLDTDFDGVELRVTRPAKGGEPHDFQCFVFAPPG